MSVLHHSVAKRCIFIFPQARGHITKVLKDESSWQPSHTAGHKNAFFVTNDVSVIRQRFAQPDTFAPLGAPFLSGLMYANTLSPNMQSLPVYMRSEALSKAVVPCLTMNLLLSQAACRRAQL